MRALHSLPLLPLLVAIGLLLSLPGGPAGAASDRVIRNSYTDQALGVDVCGFTVDIATAGTFRATIHQWIIGPNDPPADNFWIGNFNDHGASTVTNRDNGKTVVVSWINNIKEASMVNVGDDLWDYTFSQNGIPIRVGNKPIDRGRIVIVNRLNLGELSTDTDDSFVSGMALSVSGPHPVYQSPDAYCDAISAAIG